jgi:predicted oxidoreductase
MAAGAVVVATPGSLAAFAFPPGAVVTADSAEGLAAEATRLIEDAEARERVAARARRLVAAYGADAQQDRLDALLEAARYRGDRGSRAAPPP